jgi:hypothetical protein
MIPARKKIEKEKEDKKKRESFNFILRSPTHIFPKKEDILQKKAIRHNQKKKVIQS